jgi:hypothetical protein
VWEEEVSLPGHPGDRLLGVFVARMEVSGCGNAGTAGAGRS